jgi:hypothetical protein
MVKKMVYCTKCGTKNDDDAVNCVKCNEPLQSYRAMRRERRRKENECFGLPNGGAIFGIIIGLMIIVWGLTTYLHIDFNWFPLLIVIFGTLMVLGALYTMKRKR